MTNHQEFFIGDRSSVVDFGGSGFQLSVRRMSGTNCQQLSREEAALLRDWLTERLEADPPFTPGIYQFGMKADLEEWGNYYTVVAETRDELDAKMKEMVDKMVRRASK